MKHASLLLAALTAGLFSIGASAQPGPGSGMGGMGPGQGGSPRQAAPADCGKARNPAQCEARLKAREACKDKKGPDRRACIDDNLPAPDCAKAKSPQRCEARQKAREACKGKYGPERRQCLREQKPAAPAAAQKKS